MDRKKKIITVVLCLFILWVITGFTDYSRVCHSFEKPIFAIPAITSDDGGSGKYQGLGYSFKIKGNFMPEDELPGVTHVEYYLFGHLVNKRIRD